MVTFHIITFSIMVTIIYFFSKFIKFFKKIFDKNYQLNCWKWYENWEPTLNMALNMISFYTSKETNSYTYTSNAKSQTVNYWICSESKCSARIRKWVSSSNLVGDLPIHQQENKVLPVSLLQGCIRLWTSVILQWQCWIYRTCTQSVCTQLCPTYKLCAVLWGICWRETRWHRKSNLDWGHWYAWVLESQWDGIQTNTWTIISGFGQKKLETKITLVSNAAGQDLHTNSGGKAL